MESAPGEGEVRGEELLPGPVAEASSNVSVGSGFGAKMRLLHTRLLASAVNVTIIPEQI